MPRRQKTPAPPKPLTDYPRKHCKNCPKFFYQTKPTKEFCSDTCRAQFHRFGGSFGALKETLTKLMKKEAAPIVAATFDDYVGGKTFKAAMAANGFIHRSQMRKRKIVPKHMRPEALLQRIDALEAIIKRLTGPPPQLLSEADQRLGDGSNWHS